MSPVMSIVAATLISGVSTLTVVTITIMPTTVMGWRQDSLNIKIRIPNMSEE